MITEQIKQCFNCGSNTTRLWKGREDWRKDKQGNLICRKCYGKAWSIAHMNGKNKVKEAITKKPTSTRRIIEGSIIKQATPIGGTGHVTVPVEWIGKMIRCIPVD
ncbi:MAG: DUF2080 family transposase-associated protein [Thermoproteota archaeon]|nr:DUF2080 family transposase-associated protein [Thermoproteota archaeon]